jgi:hypothetical protein
MASNRKRLPIAIQAGISWGGWDERSSAVESEGKGLLLDTVASSVQPLEKVSDLMRIILSR